MSIRQWKNQIILALSLVIFGYFVYWLEFSRRPQNEENEELAKKIIPIKEKSIETIKLVDSKNIFEFKCLDIAKNLCKPGDHSSWEIIQPMKTTADRGNVNALVSSLNNVSATQTIDLSDEPAEKRLKLLQEYGLDENSRTSNGFKRVEIRTKDGIESIAYLGTTHPIGDQIFVATAENGKMNSNRVLLIPKYFQSNFEHKLSYWRNKKLFQKSKYEIGSFRYKAGRVKFTATKTNGEWNLHTTIRGKKSLYRGDIEAVDGWISNLTHINAKGFAADQADSPKGRKIVKWAKKLLEVEFKEKEEKIKFILFERKPKDKPVKLYASISSHAPLFEVENGVRNRIIKAIRDFRQTKLISSLEKFNANRIEISGSPVGETPIILTKTEDQWLSNTNPNQLDTKKVKNLLEKLSGKRIKDFLVRTPRGSNDGIQIILGDRNITEKRKFLFWKGEKDKLYAKDLKSKQKEIYLIDPAVKDALPWGKSSFFKKESTPIKTNGKPNT